MITIRPAEAADAARLLVIWKEAVRMSHDFLTAEDIAFYREQVRDSYLPALEVWVAEAASGSVLGFAGLAENKVEMLFVDPARHGEGVGRALLQHARQRKGRLSVDVNEQNPAAHAFYLKYGFRDIGYSPLDGSGRPFPLIHMMQPE